MSVGTFPKYMNRIHKEIDNCEDFSRTCITYDLVGGAIHIKCLYNDKYTVRFELNKYYPFKPPLTMSINNNVYDHNLWALSQDTYAMLNYHYNITCFCCESRLCDKNWAPACSLVSLVEEIFHNQNLVKAIYALNMLKYNSIFFLPEIEKEILSFCYGK